MKNNKGFTMIELLATIVIIGILSTIGIVATNRYLVNSRAKSYKIMSQSVYEAGMNCMLEGKCPAPTVTTPTVEYETKNLVDYGYLEPLANPATNREPCFGKVMITLASNEHQKYNYKYDVSLKCDGVANAVLPWPDTKSADENKIMSQIKSSANTKTDPMDAKPTTPPTVSGGISGGTSTGTSGGTSGGTSSGTSGGTSSGTSGGTSGTTTPALPTTPAPGANVSGANQNIMQVLEYSESGTNKCIYGSESTCKASTCHSSTTANSCRAGTLIQYKVNASKTVQFYVLKDNGTTLTLMQTGTSSYGSTWGTSQYTTYGPNAIVTKLNELTSDWSNVNTMSYTIGNGSSSGGVYSGCGTSASAGKYVTCTTNSYSTGFSGFSGKARIITMQELLTHCTYDMYNNSCPYWLRDRAAGYWTANVYSDNASNVWYVTNSARTSSGGSNSLTTTSPTAGGPGIKPVVIVNKK